MLNTLREIYHGKVQTSLVSLKSCDRNKVKEEVKKVNAITGNIKIRNVTECNNLLYSAAYLVTERLGKLEKKAKSKAK